MKRVAALLGCLLFAIFGTSSAYAAKPLRLQLLTTSAQIIPGVPSKASTNIRVIVSGGKKATLSLEVIDLVLQASGKSPLPAGSTRYSLANQVHFEPKAFNYVPNGIPRQFVFKVTANNRELNEVRFGGIQTTLATESSQNSAAAKIAAITTFAIVPKGLELNLGSSGLKSSEVSDMRLVQSSKLSLADWIFPDIPGIANQAPVKLELEVVNKNELPVFSSQSVTWSTGSEKLLVKELPQRLLFSSQKIKLVQDSTKSMLNLTSKNNFAKPFKSIKAQVVISTFLGNQDLKPLTREVAIFVFPWKEILFWILILVVVSWQIIRSRRRQVPNFQPNIVWLFLIWVAKNSVKKIKTYRNP